MDMILSPNGKEYTLVGINSCENGVVVIPETHEGVPITRICDSAFYERLDVERIFLPKTIKSIGRNAFYLCANLKSVEFGKDSALVEIDRGAFSGCDMLKQISIPKKVEYIGMFAFQIDDVQITLESGSLPACLEESWCAGGTKVILSK